MHLHRWRLANLIRSVLHTIMGINTPLWQHLHSTYALYVGPICYSVKLLTRFSTQSWKILYRLPLKLLQNTSMWYRNECVITQIHAQIWSNIKSRTPRHRWHNNINNLGNVRRTQCIWFVQLAIAHTFYILYYFH